MGAKLCTTRAGWGSCSLSVGRDLALLEILAPLLAAFDLGWKQSCAGNLELQFVPRMFGLHPEGRFLVMM